MKCVSIWKYNSGSRDLPDGKCMMLQNNASVKGTFQVQDRPVDFNVTEYSKFADMVSDFALQLIFKKVLLFKLWCSSNLQLSEKAIKILFCFPAIY